MYPHLSFLPLLKNILFFFLILNVKQTGATEKASDCLFVSHQTGQDTPLCGSSVQPCQTLTHALLMVSEGGKICLDGRKSKTHPYSCLPKNVTEETKVLVMNKSVTIQGWFSKAHVFCFLVFRRASSRILRLTLSNVIFKDYGVYLYGVSCSNVIISNCSFINCDSAVVLKQLPSRVCRKSSLEITDTEFLYNNISVNAKLSHDFFLLKISRCVFQGNMGSSNVISSKNNVNGNVYIESIIYRNGIHVYGMIADSVFKELGHLNDAFALSFKLYGFFSAGNLSISNTTFLNNRHALFAYGSFQVQLTKVTINYTYGHAIMASGPPKVNARIVGIKVFLEHCTVGHNRYGITMAINICVSVMNCSAGEKTLDVRHSSFLGTIETRDTGHAISFQVDDGNLRPAFIEAAIILENVTFQEIHGFVLESSIQRNVRGLIIVKNCTFLNNSQFVHQLNDISIVKIEFDVEHPPPKSSLRKKSNSCEFIWKNNYQFPVIFKNTIFKDNFGISAALMFSNGNVSFKNCTFQNNEGLTLGGHVYMKTGYGRLNIVNSTFIQTRSTDRLSDAKQRRVSSNGCFLHSESAGPVIITNSSFTANVSREFNPIFATTKTSLLKVDSTSTLQCPSGRQVKLDKMENTEGFQLSKGSSTCWMKVNYVKIFCEECPDEFYSLQRGLATGLDVSTRTLCLKCPYRASCEDGNVKAKDNFWGLKLATHPPSLKFFSCPLEYCRNPGGSNHYNYNACHGNRSGVLCGKCSDGYSEALYSTSCRKKEKCNDHWFWLATAIYVVAFAVYIVFKPPIFSVLYRQTLWFTNTPGSACEQPPPYEDAKEHDSGYLKIVFYFYQVAELVMIDSPEKALHIIPFIPPVIALFNFQVKTLDGSIGCPFPGLTVVTKELFLCLKFLATMLSIGVIYVIHRAAGSSRYVSAPSITLYLAVALETLLLGYERLAETTLKLMHCIPMEMDWRLFVDGNIQCWQWWQYLMITFMVVFIIPLILVLFWGSLLLAKDKLSTKEFLVACAFPLPCLFSWIIRHCKKEEDEVLVFFNDTEEIKRVLHDPFRESSNDDHGTLYWESVLTGRRLILLTVHTFATNPLVRLLCLNCTCFFILLHHLAMKPFRKWKANMFESLSLASLVTICTFSLAEATYVSEGLELKGPIQDLFHALQWIKIALLSVVPAVVCILVVFAVLSQLFRLLYHCISLLSDLMWCKCFIRDRSLDRLSLSRQHLLYYEPEELQCVA